MDQLPIEWKVTLFNGHVIVTASYNFHHAVNQSRSIDFIFHLFFLLVLAGWLLDAQIAALDVDGHDEICFVGWTRRGTGIIFREIGNNTESFENGFSFSIRVLKSSTIVASSGRISGKGPWFAAQRQAS